MNEKQYVVLLSEKTAQRFLDVDKRLNRIGWILKFVVAWIIVTSVWLIFCGCAGGVHSDGICYAPLPVADVVVPSTAPAPRASTGESVQYFFDHGDGSGVVISGLDEPTYIW